MTTENKEQIKELSMTVFKLVLRVRPFKAMAFQAQNKKIDFQA
jgi:hypothetical protein